MKKLFMMLVAVISMSGCAMFSSDCGSATNGSVVDTVYFDYDSSVLKAETVATLNALSDKLIYEDTDVLIEGHCDERGTTDYNLALGSRRASAIAVYLELRGVKAEKIKTISFGKERPAVEGSNETAWAKNRRGVVLKVNEK